MLRKTIILLSALITMACGTTEESSLIAFPRDAAGYTLLDPAPAGAVELPDGAYRLTIEGEEKAHILAFDGKIFNITFSQSHSGGEEISDIVEKALRRFGEPSFSDGNVFRFEDENTLATLAIGRSSYTISLSDKVLTAKALGGEVSKAKSLLQIPLGKPVQVDGMQSGNEWSDALPLGTIQVEEDWAVPVFAKHDGENLCVIFYNLQPEEERYITAEVLLDIDGNLSAEWEPDNYWLHASFNDCEAIGNYNIWDCVPELPGWQANNLPLTPPGLIEFSISFEKLGITDPSGTRIGFAIDVTDTQKRWLFWPSDAVLESPATWAIVYLE